MKTQDLKSFLQRWLINTLAVLVATLVLGILNSFLRPLLMLISLPLLIFTLGLFTLVINALLLYFVGNLVTGFHVVNFKAAFWGALVISVVSFAVNTIAVCAWMAAVTLAADPSCR